MSTVLTILLALLGALHLAGCALVCRRLLRKRREVPPAKLPPLTVLRPVCGLDPDLDRTLATSFGPLCEQSEVIFCVASATDPAIPLVRNLIARHPETPARLLIGDATISENPKLNNLAKGWAAARYDWIAMIDSNVLLPRDFKAQLFARWDEDTGLVTSPPAGIEPAGIAGSLECAFLNTYQDRWQLAADELNIGFAQGKVLMWQRNLLDAAGGPAALGRHLAEDVAATRVVRAAGKRVRVVTKPFAQPIRRRTPRDVWDRQVRWARVRREGFPALFALEPLSGGLVPLLCALMLVHWGMIWPSWVVAGLFGWYGAEWALARAGGWPSGPRDVLSFVLRDATIPLIWAASFASRGFVWRGNHMAPGQLNGNARPETGTDP